VALTGNTVRVVGVGDLSGARSLVFEYMAETQREAGRAVPRDVDELPGVLRAECSDLVAAYAPPGALLLAHADDAPIGCVGLMAVEPPGTAEVKRLYVRPAHRGGGTARLLMEEAHRHAAESGFDRLVLDVMASRTRVIDFYRRLGYTDAEPTPQAARYSMVCLQRRC
jgi:ribosomal protein S18 acetylase RimI-like enzyme